MLKKDVCFTGKLIVIDRGAIGQKMKSFKEIS